MSDESALLRRFVDDHSETAFRQLTERHLGLVYHTALRRTDGDVHLAEEATQHVFCDLARKAPQLVGHPNLIGWLHTSARYATSSLTRAMLRRQTHEQSLESMSEPTVEPPPENELPGVIDDALEALPAADREAILLRFFESQSFAKIGTRLNLSEDAARMKTSRAVEKLRHILGARGITSTAAALSGALAASASPAPATLSSAVITSRSLSDVAGTVTAASTSGGVSWLTSAPMAWSVAAASAVISMVLFVRTPTTPTISSAATAESTHSTPLAPETTNLSKAIPSPSETVSAPESDLTKEAVQNRYQRGKDYAKSGRYDEALNDFAWCFEIGMRRITDFAGVRVSFLINDLRGLAQRHPPAREYLEQKRLDALSTFDDPINGNEASAELAAINEVLGRDSETLELFLTLPTEDPRRLRLARNSVVDLLRDRQRYADAATTITVEGIIARFEGQTHLASIADQLPRSALAIGRQQFIRSVAKKIEILAGADRTTEARFAIEMLCVYDASPETLDLLRHHLTRAGHPELMSEVPAAQPVQ